jgi:hypothetical protein
LYQQTGRLVLHIVNLTSAATWRQPLEELIAIGPLEVKVKLPAGITGKNLKGLVSNAKLSSRISKGFAEFQIPSILDHEVVVIS